MNALEKYMENLEDKEYHKSIKFMQQTKFQAQPFRSTQCGQTCVAMITGNSIEEVCKKMEKQYYTNLQTDLKKYLDSNGYKTLLCVGEVKINEVPNNSIIRFNKPDETGHFALKNEIGEIYDPAVGIVKAYLNHYTISHYLQFEKK